MKDNNHNKLSKGIKEGTIISIDEAKELSEIINKGNLVGFMEFITGLAGTSKSELFMSVGRIGQAIVKGESYKQLFIEIHELRKRGKINDEYLNSQYGKKDFADILKAIDEENLDPKKLEAMKNVFYFCISKEINEKTRARTHYLMQICMNLNAFDIEVLGVCYSTYKTPNHPYQGLRSAGDWIRIVSDKLEYGLPEFVEKSDERLINLGLLGSRTYTDKSGINCGVSFRLTTLGIALCELINNS